LAPLAFQEVRVLFLIVPAVIFFKIQNEVSLALRWYRRKSKPTSVQGHASQKRHQDKHKNSSIHDYSQKGLGRVRWRLNFIAACQAVVEEFLSISFISDEPELSDRSKKTNRRD